MAKTKKGGEEMLHRPKFVKLLRCDHGIGNKA